MHVSVGNNLHNLTGTWRFLRPVYEDKVPACQNACPVGNDIEAWIRLLQKEDFQAAYWHLKREQPFPAVLGRVCFGFCQEACNRAGLDQCVRINALERFLGDQVPASIPFPDLPDHHGMKLAVVGSGPAGMAAAYFSRLLGFKTTIYERHAKPGGILRVGIPGYRLPKEIVDDEFEGLLHMGIELRTETTIGKDISLKELCEQNDYIFCGTGVNAGVRLGIPGEEDTGRVMSGLDYLRRVAEGEKASMEGRVVVIGGGNTAVDAARTAIRRGAQVSVLYRRTEAEMPAHPSEVREAREEGVFFHFLAAPERIATGVDGKISSVICSSMRLASSDETGRPRPVKIEGSEFEIPADFVLSAIGEKADLAYLEDRVAIGGGVVGVDARNAIRSNGSKPRIFAGGDITDIPHTVTHAIASGKRAAIAMDCLRKGLDFSQIEKRISIGAGPGLSLSRYVGWQGLHPVPQDLHAVVDASKVVFDYFREAAPIREGSLAGPERRGSFVPYIETYTRDQALREALRCMHCGRCTECDNCLIFCPDLAVLPRGDGRFGYSIDYDYCKGCGICATECPRNAITLLSEETPIEQEEA
jgi:2-oxoacid:acceptor oxidoreductase delta subunit (pyruvate/2-ketoisovalerate family)